MSLNNVLLFLDLYKKQSVNLSKKAIKKKLSEETKKFSFSNNEQKNYHIVSLKKK